MPTREDLMGALRQADAAGDTAAATRFAQMLKETPQESAPAPPQPGGLSPAARNFAMSDQPGYVEQFVGGAKHAWDKAAYGLASMFGDNPALKKLSEEGGAFVKETGPTSTVGQIGGDIAMTAGPTGVLNKTLLGLRGARAALAGDIGLQAGYGALTGGPDERTEGAMGGAAGAVGGNLLAKAVSKGLPGVSQQARNLMDTTDIQPTVGMAVPKLNALERFSQRVPIIGEFTTSARNRALKEFSEDAIYKAVPTLPKMKGTPEQLLDAANEHASQLYRDVVPHLKPTMDQLLSMDAAYKQVMSKPYLSEAERNTIDRIFKPMLKGAEDFNAIKTNPMRTAEEKALASTEVLNRAGGYGKWTGKDLKQFDSELGAQVRKYHRSPSTQDLGDAIYTIQRGLREGFERAVPVEQQGAMRNANTAYRNLVAVNKAASQAAEGEVALVTPRKLNRAIAARDAVEPTQTTGELAEFGKLGQRVLPQAASSSSISGAGLAGGLLGAGSLAYTGHLPAVLVAGTLAGVGSTRPAQAALLGNTAAQRAFAEALRKAPIQSSVGGALYSGED